MSGNQSGSRPLKWVAAVVILIALSAFPVWYFLRPQTQTQTPATQPVEETRGVSCLGKIQPEGGVIHVAGPYIWGDSHPPRVESLKVKEGDEVRRGQALAVFVGRANLQASVAQAQTQIAKARRRVEQVKAGAKKPDMAAQQAEVSRLEAEEEHARTDLRRYEALRATDDVTVAEVETRRNAVRVGEFAVEAARHRLASIQEVPAADVHLAEADLAEAEANEQRARRDFDGSTIYAPADGRVLRINTLEGEGVGPDGLLDIARTNRMFVVAEVYETDISRVRVGERARVSGDILGTTTLTGVVERIAHNVKEAAVMPGDTVTFTDKRVIETLIRLDQNEPAAHLIGGKVTVIFQP